MKITVLLSILISFVYSSGFAATLFTENYDSETAGDELTSVSAQWTQNAGGSDTAEVTSADGAKSSSKSIILKSNNPVVDVDRAYESNSYTYGYTEIYVKPVALAVDTTDVQDVIDSAFLVTDGIYLTLDKNGSYGDFWTADGDGPGSSNEVAVDTEASVQLGTGDIASEWVHLVFKQKYTGTPAGPTECDLFVQGDLVKIDLGGEDDYATPTGIILLGDLSTDSYFDELGVTDSNPLFEDSDNDAMPDWFEDAHSLLKNDGSDRDGVGGDYDSDGDDNIIEYMNKTPVNYAGSGNTSGEYFVNNLVGSSSYDGKAAYFTSGTEGPKDDLTDAIGEITTSGTINIFPGDGNGYTEGTIALGTKTITLVPQGTVTITP